MPLSDHEIRNKYGLSDSVPVRRELPTARELATRPSFLLRTAQAFGSQEWMWETVGGVLLGVIVIAPAVDGVIQFWARKIEASYEYAAPYLVALSKTGVRLSEDLVAFVESSSSAPQGDGDRGGRLVLAPFDATTLNPPGNALTEEKITLWRIVSARHIEQAFQYPVPVDTPWLRRGALAAFAAEHLLQAILEVVITGSHVPDQALSKFLPDRVLIRASLASPSTRVVTSVDVKQHNGDTRKLAHRWLKSMESALLLVPSRTLSDSRTVIVNLRHPDAQRLEIEEVIPLNKIATNQWGRLGL